VFAPVVDSGVDRLRVVTVGKRLGGRGWPPVKNIPHSAFAILTPFRCAFSNRVNSDREIWRNNYA